MTGKLLKIYYRRRSRVPRWWPFRWPPKWFDSHITCDSITFPALATRTPKSDNLVWVDDGKLWVSDGYGTELLGPYESLEIYAP